LQGPQSRHEGRRGGRVGEHRVPQTAQGRGRHGSRLARLGAGVSPGRPVADDSRVAVPSADIRGAVLPLPRPLISVAPMMDLTDRHYRYVARLLSRRVLLYSEMITARAVLFGDRSRLLAFSSAETPVVLQLGGDDPASLAEAAAI